MSEPSFLQSILNHGQSGRIYFDPSKREIVRTGYGWGKISRMIRWCVHKKVVKQENRATFDLFFSHVGKNLGEYSVNRLKSDPVIGKKYTSGDSITQTVSSRMREIIQEQRKSQVAYLHRACLPGGTWYREISDRMMAANGLSLGKVQIDGKELVTLDEIPLTPERRRGLEAELHQIFEQYRNGGISLQDAVSASEAVTRKQVSEQMKQYMDFFDRKQIQGNGLRTAILVSWSPGLALIDAIGLPARGNGLVDHIGKANSALQRCIQYHQDIQEILQLHGSSYLPSTFQMLQELSPNSFTSDWNDSIGCQYQHMISIYNQNPLLIPNPWKEFLPPLGTWLNLAETGFPHSSIAANRTKQDAELIAQGFDSVFVPPPAQPEPAPDLSMDSEMRWCRFLASFFQSEVEGKTISPFEDMVSDVSVKEFFQPEIFLKGQTAVLKDRVMQSLSARREELVSCEDDAERMDRIRTIVIDCMDALIQDRFGMSSVSWFSREELILNTLAQTAKEKQIQVPPYTDTISLMNQIQEKLKTYENQVPPLSRFDARNIVVSIITNFLEAKSNINFLIDEMKGLADSGKNLLKRLNWMNGSFLGIGAMLKFYRNQTRSIEKNLIQPMTRRDGIPVMISFFQTQYSESFGSLPKDGFRDLCQFTWEWMRFGEQGGKPVAIPQSGPVLEREKQSKQSQAESMQFLISPQFQYFVEILIGSADSGATRAAEHARTMVGMVKDLVNAVSRAMDTEVVEESRLKTIQETLVNWKPGGMANQADAYGRIVEKMKKLSLPERMKIIDAGLVEYDTVESYGTAEGIGFRGLWDPLKTEWKKRFPQADENSESRFRDAVLDRVHSRLASMESVTTEQAAAIVSEVSGQLLEKAVGLKKLLQEYRVLSPDARIFDMLRDCSDRELNAIELGIPLAVAPLAALYEAHGVVQEDFGKILMDNLEKMFKLPKITMEELIKSLLPRMSHLLGISPDKEGPSDKRVPLDGENVSPNSMAAHIRYSIKSTVSDLEGEISSRLSTQPSSELSLAQTYLQFMIPQRVSEDGFVPVGPGQKEIRAVVDAIAENFF